MEINPSDTNPVLILEGNPRRAIEIGRALAPLDIPLRHLSETFDRNTNGQKIEAIALVLGDRGTRRREKALTGCLTAAGIPVLQYTNPAALRRRICALRLKFGCNKVMSRISEPRLGADASLDKKSRSLTFEHGQNLPLGQTEFAIMLLLASRMEKILYKSDLLRELWGRVDKFAARSLDVYVFSLRQKLKNTSTPLRILSVPRIGFILTGEARKTPRLRVARSLFDANSSIEASA